MGPKLAFHMGPYRCTPSTWNTENVNVGDSVNGGNKQECLSDGPVLIEETKYQQSILGFVVVGVHVLYYTLWAKYNYSMGQIWTTGQSLTDVQERIQLIK